MPYTYYDIGLNLFTKSFPHPEKIIEDAHAAGIQCILTGSEAEENELVNDFTKTHDVYGTAGPRIRWRARCPRRLIPWAKYVIPSAT